MTPPSEPDALVTRLTSVRGDHGAAATLVVVLLAVGSLLGLGAVVLDYGSVMAERRQLQNGADAAALVLARDCADDPAACNPTSAAAAPWVDANDSGVDLSGDAAVHSVCSGAGVAVSCASPGGGGALTSCLDPPTGLSSLWSGYVEVRAQTSVVPPLMGQVFGSPAKSAAACARAAWGPVGSLAAAFPIAISACEYDYFRDAGALAPAPQYGAGNPRPSSREVSLILKTPDNANVPGGCPASPPGGDRPGGFGYIDVDGSCTAQIDAGGTVGADPGSSVPGVCDDLVRDSLETVIWIPVYDSVIGTGNTAEYHISGFAGFYLSGYRVQSGIPADRGDIHNQCATGSAAGSMRCLFGWFVGGTPPGGTIGPGTDFGASAVQIAG
jgi:hypothetical protein